MAEQGSFVIVCKFILEGRRNVGNTGRTVLDSAGGGPSILTRAYEDDVLRKSELQSASGSFLGGAIVSF
jgi:hypothetical protein